MDYISLLFAGVLEAAVMLIVEMALKEKREGLLLCTAVDHPRKSGAHVIRRVNYVL